MLSSIFFQMFAVRIIDFGSAEHDEEIKLRNRVLREPLGLVFSEQELASESNQIHIGAFEPSGKLVGCLVLCIISSSEIKMRQVAVFEEYRGKGAGTQLVTFAERYAEEHGYKSIILHARQTAAAFYLGLKYIQTSEKQFEEVGLMHVSMMKNLSTH
jgi:predicted GNAT family N-acyltransferase